MKTLILIFIIFFSQHTFSQIEKIYGVTTDFGEENFVNFSIQHILEINDKVYFHLTFKNNTPAPASQKFVSLDPTIDDFNPTVIFNVTQELNNTINGINTRFIFCDDKLISFYGNARSFIYDLQNNNFNIPPVFDSLQFRLIGCGSNNNFFGNCYAASPNDYLFNDIYNPFYLAYSDRNLFGFEYRFSQIGDHYIFKDFSISDNLLNIKAYEINDNLTHFSEKLIYAQNFNTDSIQSISIVHSSVQLFENDTLYFLYLNDGYFEPSLRKMRNVVYSSLQQEVIIDHVTINKEFNFNSFTREKHLMAFNHNGNQRLIIPYLTSSLLARELRVVVFDNGNLVNDYLIGPNKAHYIVQSYMQLNVNKINDDYFYAIHSCRLPQK